MSERETHPRLEPYLDGELDPAGAAGVEAHLACCAVCREAVAAARSLDAWVAEPLPELPPAFAAGTRDRALARRLPLSPLWWLAAPRPWRLGVAALLVVAGFAGARIGRAAAGRRSATVELAAALTAPATDAILAAPPVEGQR